MDKKLLVSLMMTAPVASAFASEWNQNEVQIGDDTYGNNFLKYVVSPNATAGQDNWTVIGSQAAGLVETTDASISIKLGTGSLSHVNMGMLKGYYIFKYAGLNNAILKVNDRYLAETTEDGTAYKTKRTVKVDGVDTQVIIPVADATDTDVPDMFPQEGATFEYDAYAEGTTLSLYVIPQAANAPYGIGKVEGVLDFNFTNCYNDLTSQLDAIKTLLEATLDFTKSSSQMSSAWTSLDTEKKGLEKTYKALLARVAKVNPAQAAPEEGTVTDVLKTAYTNEQLDLYGDKDEEGELNTDTKDKLTTDIEALKTGADKYKENVDSANKDWENVQNNNELLTGAKDGTGKAGWNAQYNSLKTQVNGLEVGEVPDDVTGDLKSYLEYAMQAGIDNAKTALAALNTSLQNIKSNMKVALTEDQKEAIKTQIAEVKNQIASVDVTNATNNFEVFTYFLGVNTEVPSVLQDVENKTNVKAVETAYLNDQYKINDVATKYTKFNGTVVSNVYADWVTDTSSELGVAYAGNTGYAISQKDAYNEDGKLNTSNPAIAYATVDNYKKANETMNERIAAMDALPTALAEKVNLQNKYWFGEDDFEGALEKINSYADDVQAIVAMLDNSAIKEIANNESLIAKIKAVKTAYENLQTTSEGLFLDHTICVDNAFNSEYNGTDGVLGKFTKALEEYNTEVEKPAFAGPVAAINAYETAKVEIGKLIASDDLYGSKINENLINPGLEFIKEQVDAYVKDPSTSVSGNIKDACTELVSTCEAVVNAFANVEKQVKDATDVANKLIAESTAAQTNLVVDPTTGKVGSGAPTDPYTWNDKNDSNVSLTGEIVKNNVASDNVILGKIAEAETVTIAGVEYECSNPTLAIEAAKALSDDMNADDYVVQVNNARAELAKAVATANKNALAHMESYLAQYTEGDGALAANVPGMANLNKLIEEIQEPEKGDGVEIAGTSTSVNALINTAWTAYNNAGTNGAVTTLQTALAKVNTKCKSVANAYSQVFADLMKIVANKTAYDAVKKNLQTVQSQANGVDILSLTTPDAAPFYTGKLNTIKNNISNQLKEDKSKSILWSNYQALTAATNRATLDAKVTELSNSLQQLLTDIQSNNTAFLAIQSEYNSVSADATKLEADINAYDRVDTYKETYLNDIANIKTQLDSLFADSKSEFAKGASAADKDDAISKMKGLADQLADIKSGELKGYYDQVMKANTKYLETAHLNGTTLDDDYKNAVETISKYYFVTNKSYFDAMQASVDFVSHYGALQACVSEVAKYKNDYDAFLDDLVPGYVSENMTAEEIEAVRNKWIVLSDAAVDALEGELKTDYDALGSDYLSIEKTIKDESKDATSAAYTVATTFYTDNVENGGLKNYDDIKSGLTTAGLEDDEVTAALVGQENLKVLTNAYNSIVTAYTNGVKDEDGNWVEGKKPLKDFMPADGALDSADADVVKAAMASMNTYILGIDNIADTNEILLSTNVDDDIDAGVGYQWTQLYDETVAKLNEYIENIGTPTTVEEDNNLTTLTTAKTEAAGINTEWSELETSAYSDEYATFKANLSSKTSSALTLGANLASAEAKAKAEYDLYEAPNSPMASAEAAALGVLEYSSYRPDQVLYYDDLLEQVEQIKTDNASSDITNKDTYAEVANDFGKLATSLDAISNYWKMYTLECNYAKYNLLVAAQAAFNNANGKVDTKVLDGYNTEINDIKTALEELIAFEESAFNDGNKQSQIEKVRTQEEALCKLIDAIETAANVTSDQRQLYIANADYENALAAANASVEALKNIYNSADEYGDYGTEVKSDFNDEVTGLEGQVTAVENDVKALASTSYMIMNLDEYKYKLNQVADDINVNADGEAQKGGVAAELQAAVDQAKEYKSSDDIYDDCVEVVNALKTDIVYANGLASSNVASATAVTYASLIGDINGTEAEGSVVATPGILKSLEKTKSLHGFTGDPEDESTIEKAIDDASSMTYTELVNKVNMYVRNTLTNVALEKRDEVSGKIDTVLGAIKAPGVSEDGWDYTFFQADEMMAQLVADKETLNDDYSDVKVALKVSSAPKPATVQAGNTNQSNPAYDTITSSTTLQLATAAQAKANYEALVLELNDILNGVDNIEAGLENDKIIVGDVNYDGNISVADIQTLITYVGEGVVLDDSKDSAVKDVNGNKLLNIADVSTLINIWLNHENGSSASAAARLASFLPAANGNNSYMVAEVQGENGLRRFAVNLANEVNFVAGQLDIILPSHARVAGVHVGDRANALDTYVFENDGYTRVLMTALDNSPIEGNNGCVLFIDVDGNAEVEVENVIFSDANGKDYFVSNSTESGVGIMDAVKDGVKAIYNAAGQKLNKLTKGVNIVRNADGTVTKKIGK
ncbi:MAG: hypothetical protein NC095_01565 [Muribaculum sp.]|nr:hypothetical protein [Muribaculum sp.]